MSGSSKANYVAVVTARAGSQRLPGKNMFCLAGQPLAVHAIRHGIAAGIPVVVTTDIPLLKTIAVTLGAVVVDRPEFLAGPDCSHADTVRHAVEASGHADRNVVLLQPTSPFRFDNVVDKCVAVHAENPDQTVATCRQLHDWQLGAENRGLRHFINGCVIVYPAGRVGDYANVVPVETNPLNYLEIDTEDDYVNACLLSLKYQMLPSPVAPDHLTEVIDRLKELELAGKPCTLVARADGLPIPQEHPVCYVNHCRGYDGGRADVLFFVANPNSLKEENPELRECAAKCRVAVIRNHGKAEEILARYPELKEKSIILKWAPHKMIDQVTTGAIAQYILGIAECQTTRVGFSTPAHRAADQTSGHFLGASYDTAIFTTYGTPRQ